jgi:Protein of unknown function (DUF551)
MTSRSRMELDVVEEIFWISVEDELPDTDRTVMVFGGELESTWLGWYECAKDAERGVWRDVSADVITNITHWAEVPQGPEAESEDDDDE